MEEEEVVATAATAVVVRIWVGEEQHRLAETAPRNLGRWRIVCVFFSERGGGLLVSQLTKTVGRLRYWERLSVFRSARSSQISNPKRRVDDRHLGR